MRNYIHTLRIWQCGERSTSVGLSLPAAESHDTRTRQPAVDAAPASAMGAAVRPAVGCLTGPDLGQRLGARHGALRRAGRGASNEVGRAAGEGRGVARLPRRGARGAAAAGSPGGRGAEPPGPLHRLRGARTPRRRAGAAGAAPLPAGRAPRRAARRLCRRPRRHRWRRGPRARHRHLAGRCARPGAQPGGGRARRLPGPGLGAGAREHGRGGKPRAALPGDPGARAHRNARSGGSAPCSG